MVDILFLVADIFALFFSALILAMLSQIAIGAYRAQSRKMLEQQESNGKTSVHN